jgi:hypothetical protein
MTALQILPQAASANRAFFFDSACAILCHNACAAGLRGLAADPKLRAIVGQAGRNPKTLPESKICSLGSMCRFCTEAYRPVSNARCRGLQRVAKSRNQVFASNLASNLAPSPVPSLANPGIKTTSIGCRSARAMNDEADPGFQIRAPA